MEATIRIDSETAGEKRAVFWNDELSHHIIEEEIQTILRESAKNLWKSDPENGADIGTRLYRFLNGTGAGCNLLSENPGKRAIPCIFTWIFHTN